MIIKPLAKQLDRLEERWRAADARFEAIINAPDGLAPGDQLLDTMVVQTTSRARHATLIRWEHAASPSLRAALVREGLWTPRDALASCARMDATHCGSLIELLPLLPDELVGELLSHTRGGSWARNPATYHVGLWVDGRQGGDSFLWRLCARLVAMGCMAAAIDVFERIRHVGARVAALESMRTHLDEPIWMQRRAESLMLSRAQDPIRRLYALCQLSRLYPPNEAHELVREAIDGLPEGHDWMHLPGGLMLMLLSDPVARALDREGLRDELEKLVQTEGQNFADGVKFGTYDRSEDDEKRAYEGKALAALEGVKSGENLLAQLMVNADALPKPQIPDALGILVDAARSAPDNPHVPLTIMRLAARTDDEDVGAEALRSLDELVLAVPWARYSHPFPIWCQPEFALLSPGLRERTLMRAIAHGRGSTPPNLVPELRTLALIVDENERTPMLHALAAIADAPADGYLRAIAAVEDSAPALRPRSTALSVTEWQATGQRWLAASRCEAWSQQQAHRFEIALSLVGVAGLDRLARALMDVLHEASTETGTDAWPTGEP